MKSTIVNPDGRVTCPVCGAADSFVSKRTGKAKLLSVPTAGIATAAMPKRLKCNGCGANLKRGGPVKVRTPHPNSISARRARKAAETR